MKKEEKKDNTQKARKGKEDVYKRQIFNNVNMTMIESRPIPEKSFEYRFFVDFEGNLSDAGVRNALTGLAAEASVMRILGNY